MTATTPTVTELAFVQQVLAVPDQPGFGPGNTGDCTRAGLATLVSLRLGRRVDYATVPHVADYPDGYDRDQDPLYVAGWGRLWWRTTQRWLRTVHGCALAGDYDADDVDSAAHYVASHDEGRWALGTVQSPRGDWTHTVVVDLGTWTRGQPAIIWDPHPAGDAYDLPLISWTPVAPVAWIDQQWPDGYRWLRFPDDDPLAMQVLAGTAGATDA